MHVRIEIVIVFVCHCACVVEWEVIFDLSNATAGEC